jgi:hypothetical protein
MRRRHLVLAFGLCTAFLIRDVCRADVVTLTGGRRLTGRVDHREGGVVYVDTGNGQIIGVNEDDVLSVTPTDSLDAVCREAIGSVPDGDAEGLFKAALWCRSRHLNKEAEELARRVMKLDPEHAGARALLGYVFHEGRWMPLDEKMSACGFVRHDGQWVRREAADRMAEGLVLCEGEWLTPEEAQSRKGLVRYLGKWMTPEAARRLRSQRLAEWDRAKLLTAVEHTGGTGSGSLWIARTKHYVVRAADRQETADAAAAFMEALYGKLDAVFRFAKKSTGRFKVYVFNNRSEFRSFAEALNAPLAAAAIGFYDPMSQVLATYGPGSPGQDVIQILAHEGTHQFIDMVEGGEPPLWLDEGLAEYFGTVEWDGESLEMGLVNEGRLADLLAMVSTGNQIPLRALFHSEDRMTFGPAHYAEAWSLIHFMFNCDEGKNVPLLAQFFQAVKAGENQDVAFRRIIKTPVALFEKAWLGYVLDLGAKRLGSASAGSGSMETSLQR